MMPCVMPRTCHEHDIFTKLRLWNDRFDMKMIFSSLEKYNFFIRITPSAFPLIRFSYLSLE